MGRAGRYGRQYSLYLVPGLSEDQYALAVLVVLLGFLLTGLIQSIRFMRELPQGNLNSNI